MSSPTNTTSQPGDEHKPENVATRLLRARRDEIEDDRQRTLRRLEEERAKLESRQADVDHVQGVLTALDSEQDEIDRALGQLNQPANANPPQPPYEKDGVLFYPDGTKVCVECGTSWTAPVDQCPQVPEETGIHTFAAMAPTDEGGTYSPNSLLRAAFVAGGFERNPDLDGIISQVLGADGAGHDLAEILTLGLIAQMKESEATYVVFRLGKEGKLIPVSTQVPREEALKIWRRLSEAYKPTYHVVDVIA